MPRKQVGGIMDMIKDYANKATDMAKEGFDAAKSASGLDGESEEEKRRKQIARQNVQSKVHSVTPTQATAPVMPQAGGKRRRGGRKGGKRTRKAGMCGVCTGGSRRGGRKGGKRTRKAGMCGVCTGGSRRGGRKGGKKTHKKKKKCSW